MKIGILCCGFSCEDKLDERMTPWFKKAKELNLIFSIVSCRFKEYEDLNIKQDNTNTSNKLTGYWNNELIQYLAIPEISLSEAEARNLALHPLLSNNCDIIWLLDLSDEYYTEEQINNIIEYIQNEGNHFAWYRLNFRNYILDGKQWIDNFNPPRIFKTNFNGKKLKEFYWDNDINYETKEIITSIYSYKSLPNKEIGREIAHIRHLTWINNESTKKKILYQHAHFGKGNCSYKLGSNGNVCIDYDFYLTKGIQIPIIYKDE